MMVLVLVIGGGLGWIAYRARVQREAVAAIRRAGCSASYGRNPSSAHGLPSFVHRAIIDRLGPDYIEPITEIRLFGADLDALMPHVGRLETVENLELVGRNLSDEGCRHLRGLRRLKDLSIICEFPPSGLAAIEALPHLEHLTVANVRVEDRDLAHLKGLTTLTSLTLSAPKITGKGLRHLSGLTNLVTLKLWEAEIDDDALVHLRALKNLKRLAVPATHGDDALKEFSRARPNVQNGLADPRFGGSSAP
jgi:hypothetical protein